MNQDNREELKQALIKDFNELLVKEFTADWKIQRLVTGLQIDVMSLDNLEKAIDQYTQKQNDIARQEGYKKGYIDGGIAAIVAQPETPEERKKRLSDHWEDL